MELLTVHGPEATHVAELGIGTNEKAILSGELLEDEKILGTVHVAFGASAGIGGTIQVPVHLDCVVMKPDLAIDGEAVVSGRPPARLIGLGVLLAVPNFSEGRDARPDRADLDRLRDRRRAPRHPLRLRSTTARCSP